MLKTARTYARLIRSKDLALSAQSAVPCEAYPGDPRKIDAMAARVAAGLSPFHDDDPEFDADNERACLKPAGETLMNGMGSRIEGEDGQDRARSTFLQALAGEAEARVEIDWEARRMTPQQRAETAAIHIEQRILVTVREAEAEAVAREREACARLMENRAPGLVGKRLAAAIRARRKSGGT